MVSAMWITGCEVGAHVDREHVLDDAVMARMLVELRGCRGEPVS
jgi:hypothetical protein